MIKSIILLVAGLGVSCLGCALLMYISMIPSMFFKLIKIRPYAFIAIAVINFAVMIKYSAVNIVWILASVLIFIIVLGKHRAVIKESKLPERKLEDSFDAAHSEKWAYLYAFAIFMPILLNFNYICSQNLGLEQKNIFEFYWTFDYGIAQYDIVRYAIMFLPIDIIFMTVDAVSTYGKNAVRNVGEERRQENKRLKELNPDAFFDETTPIEKIKEKFNEPAADSDNDAVLQTNQKDEKSENSEGSDHEVDDILKNIMDNLD